MGSLARPAKNNQDVKRASVNLPHPLDLFPHLLPQAGWGFDLHFGAKAQDVADQFAFVGIGHAQGVAAIGVQLALLVGVPDLVLYPASAGGTEGEFGPVFGRSGKDAVAAVKLLPHGLQVDVFGRGVQNVGCFDGIDGKAAHAFAQVAPGVQVPVVAIVDELLGREGALQRFVAGAVVVQDQDLFALEGGFGNGFKRGQGQAAFTGADGAHALSELLWVQALVAEHVVQPFAQGLELGAEQAGVELLDHALDGHERQDFVLREPEAGQFGGVLRSV